MTEVVRMALQTEVVARLDDSEGASPYRGYIGAYRGYIGGMYGAYRGYVLRRARPCLGFSWRGPRSRSGSAPRCRTRSVAAQVEIESNN